MTSLELLRLIALSFLAVLLRHELVAARQPISENDIIRQCWSVVKVLPIYNVNSNAFKRFSVRHDLEDYTLNQVRESLHRHCVLRYFRLIKQGLVDNGIVIKGHRRAQMPPLYAKHLFILDFDETLIDSREQHRNPVFMHQPQVNSIDNLYAQIADEYNAENLTFGIKETYINNTFHEDRIYFDSVIFRPNVLDLIHKYFKESQFVIYSLAEASWVIPSVVLIEIYYNFVYRLRPDRYRHFYGRTGYFTFHRVITQMIDKHGRTINGKSLATARTLIGSFQDLDSIYIVDDMAFNVWSDQQNEAWWTAPYRIYGLQPPHFVVKVDHTEWQDIIKIAEQIQAEDGYFLDLIDFVSFSDEVPAVYGDGILSWIDHFELQRQVRYPREMEKKSKCEQKIGKAMKCNDVAACSKITKKEEKRPCHCFGCVIA